jgi:hypothetical protein
MANPMPAKPEYFKRKRIWWWNPWILTFAFVLMLISVPMVLWIASYGSDLAVFMFLVTYLSLLVIMMMLLKNTLIDPHIYVEKKLVNKQRKEIDIHRKQEQKDFIARELEVLARGERTPVLDVWRLQPQLQKRHKYFQALDIAVLDPLIKELWIRIQIGTLSPSISTNEFAADEIPYNALAFLRIISTDQYLHHLRNYYSRLIIEIYARREDQFMNDIPFPVFSILVNATALHHLTYAHTEGTQLSTYGDVIFNKGLEIIPHRGIDSPSLHSSK